MIALKHQIQSKLKDVFSAAPYTSFQTILPIDSQQTPSTIHKLVAEEQPVFNRCSLTVCVNGTLAIEFTTTISNHLHPAGKTYFSICQI